MMICAYCKSRVFATDRKCSACGSTVFLSLQETTPGEQPPERREPAVVYQTMEKTVYVKGQASRRSRWIALFLCLLGGGLGIHRFYVGKYGTGFFYLLTFGGFALGAFIDFFSILFGYFRDREGLLLS